MCPGVSKGALDMLTKMMGLELGPHKVNVFVTNIPLQSHLFSLLFQMKIRVNAVNPTVVMTDMGKLAWSDPAKANPMLARIPLGRFAGMLRHVNDMAYIQTSLSTFHFADVGDVVNAVLFLLSDKSAMINAAMLPVDGGFLSC